MTMNRLLTPVFWLATFLAPLAAQTIGICHQVVAATGQSVEKQGIIYSYTVGEVAAFTASGLGLMLSQGFHQPDLCMPTVGTDAPIGMADWQIELLPNPTDGWLTVRFSAEKTTALRASVFDLTGRKTRATALLAEPSGSQLDCRDLPPGVYFLRLEDTGSPAVGTFRFVKI